MYTLQIEANIVLERHVNKTEHEIVGWVDTLIPF